LLPDLAGPPPQPFQAFCVRPPNFSVGDMRFPDFQALALYRDEGIDIGHVKRTADAPTGVGFIIVETGSGDNCITIDPGANELLTASDVFSCETAFSSSAAVLTQLEILVAAAESALACGRQQGAITILNPVPVRPLPPAVLKFVDILTPNQTEARVLAGLRPNVEVEAETVAWMLIQSGVKQVVMTMGENGALIVTAESSSHV
jgi:ribokinase